MSETKIEPVQREVPRLRNAVFPGKSAKRLIISCCFAICCFSPSPSPRRATIISRSVIRGAFARKNYENRRLWRTAANEISKSDSRFAFSPRHQSFLFGAERIRYSDGSDVFPIPIAS
jgi:hypothetical protein